MKNYHCALCKEYVKQEREKELKEVKRVIELYFPDLAARRLQLSDVYDRRHRMLVDPLIARSHYRDYFTPDGKRRTLHILVSHRGKPFWAAPWFEPLTTFR